MVLRVDQEDLRNQIQLGSPVLQLEPEMQESVQLGDPVPHLLRQMESLMFRKLVLEAVLIQVAPAL